MEFKIPLPIPFMAEQPYLGRPHNCYLMTSVFARQPLTMPVGHPIEIRLIIREKERHRERLNLHSDEYYTTQLINVIYNSLVTQNKNTKLKDG